MADKDIKRYSLDELNEMAARGETETDRERLARDPGMELDESFWHNARIVGPDGKQSVLLQVDGDIIEWLKAHDEDYLSRINDILRDYVESHRDAAGSR